jgi:hypothetical protein
VKVRERALFELGPVKNGGHESTPRIRMVGWHPAALCAAAGNPVRQPG